MSKFIVMTAATPMPQSCWGQYRRVAVVEVEGDTKPKMISKRARGVVRIVKRWEKLSVGKTDRCAYRRALADAGALARALNG